MKQHANWAWTGGISRDETEDPADVISTSLRSSYPIPRTRPPRPVLIDVAALDAWNAAQDRAKDAYYSKTRR